MNPEVVIACNLDAFDAVEGRRYAELRGSVHAAVIDFQELANGFALRVPIQSSLLAALGEWIALERRCCPFLDFAVEIRSGEASAWVRLTGPDGVKEILREGLQVPLVSLDRLIRKRPDAGSR